MTWLDSGPKEDALEFRPFVPSHTRSSLLSFVYLVVRSVLRLVVWSLRSRDAQAVGCIYSIPALTWDYVWT